MYNNLRSDTPGALVMEFKEWSMLLINQEMLVSTLFRETCEDVSRSGCSLQTLGVIWSRLAER